MDLSLDLSQLPLLLLFDLFKKNWPSRLLHRFDFQDVVVRTLSRVLPTLLLSHIVHRLECGVGLLKVLWLAGVETTCLYRSCVISLPWFLLRTLFCFWHPAGVSAWGRSRLVECLFAKVTYTVTLVLAQLFSYDCIATWGTRYPTMWPFYRIHSSVEELWIRFT